VSVRGRIFTFNPNTGAKTEQLNTNFQEGISSDVRLGAEEYSPAEITAQEDNFSTRNAENQLIGVLRLSTDASRTITGLKDGEKNRFLYVLNVGSFNLVLANQSVSSDAANRIITGTGGNLTIAADTAEILYYDSTTVRWRII